MKSAVSTAAAAEMMMPASAIPSPASPVVRICWRAMTPQIIPAGQKMKAATKEAMAKVLVCVGVRSNAWVEDERMAPRRSYAGIGGVGGGGNEAAMLAPQERQNASLASIDVPHCAQNIVTPFYATTIPDTPRLHCVAP